MSEVVVAPSVVSVVLGATEEALVWEVGVEVSEEFVGEPHATATIRNAIRELFRIRSEYRHLPVDWKNLILEYNVRTSETPWG